MSTGIAFFILFSGIISILFSFALGMVYKKRFDMEYLGWCMVMGAIWMLGESKMRQLLVPNASALGSLCFVMILLSPLPIILMRTAYRKSSTTVLTHVSAGSHLPILQPVLFWL